MRAFSVLALVAACSPDVAPGAYLCGPDGSCPEDQVCNPADGVCVLPALVQPFQCVPDFESEPDDALDQAFPLELVDCGQLGQFTEACMPADDVSDWYELTVPASCGARSLDARVSFSVGFEELTLELVDLATGAVLGTGTSCEDPGDRGVVLSCVTGNLVPDTRYGLHVIPTGDGDCDGDCAYNRYTLRLRLAGP